jgi:aryl-alcohol dehydrogenase-like predicted oxidoreductase
VLGAALKGRREQAIISTKLSLRAGPGPNDVGASRHHLIEATERALPAASRLHETAAFAPPVAEERLYDIVAVLDGVAGETGKTVPQVAINWLLQRPTVATVLIGARNESELRDNLGAVGWNLTTAQVRRLDAVRRVWNGQFTERNPPPV